MASAFEVLDNFLPDNNSIVSSSSASAAAATVHVQDKRGVKRKHSVISSFDANNDNDECCGDSLLLLETAQSIEEEQHQQCLESGGGGPHSLLNLLKKHVANKNKPDHAIPNVDVDNTPNPIKPTKNVTTTTTTETVTLQQYNHQMKIQQANNVQPGDPNYMEWLPATISSDYDIYHEYGTDPSALNNKHRQGDKSGCSCAGCALRPDKSPLKLNNYTLFVKKTMEDADRSDSVTRAKQIHDDYDKLIAQPKKRLKRTVLGGQTTQQQQQQRPFTSDNIIDNGLLVHHHREQQQEEKEDLIDEWDVPQIFAHIKYHKSDTVEDIRHFKETLKRLFYTVERNSLVVMHNSKKNSFGEPLCRIDTEQFKIFKEIIDLYIKLGKSRPDQMIPFTDPLTANSAMRVGSLGTSTGDDNKNASLISLIETSGKLLYNKKGKMNNNMAAGASSKTTGINNNAAAKGKKR